MPTEGAGNIGLCHRRRVGEDRIEDTIYRIKKIKYRWIRRRRADGRRSPDLFIEDQKQQKLHNNDGFLKTELPYVRTLSMTE